MLSWRAEILEIVLETSKTSEVTGRMIMEVLMDEFN